MLTFEVNIHTLNLCVYMFFSNRFLKSLLKPLATAKYLFYIYL